MCLGESLETPVVEQKEGETSKPVATPARGASGANPTLAQTDTQETIQYQWDDDAWWNKKNCDWEDDSWKSHPWVPSSWNSWGSESWSHHDQWWQQEQHGFETPQRPSLRRGVSNISGWSDTLISSPDSSYLLRATTTEQLDEQKHMQALVDLMPEGQKKKLC